MGPIDVSTLLPPSADPIVVSSGDANLGRGGVRSHSEVGSDAMVQVGLATQPFGSFSSQKRSHDSSPRRPRRTSEMVKVGFFSKLMYYLLVL